MYIGFFLHTVDKKNRIFIPARFRAKRATYIVSRGFEECLYLFDKNTWLKVLQKFDSLAWSDKAKQRAFKRVLLAGATETKIDWQGRLLLPSHLVEYSGIRKTAAVIGMGDRLKILTEQVKSPILRGSRLG